MKILIISLILLFVSCKESDLNSSASSENVRKTDPTFESRVDEIPHNVSVMFEPENYSTHIKLFEVPDGYTYLAVSDFEYGDINYIKDENEVFLKLRNHDDLEDVTHNSMIKIFFGNGIKYRIINLGVSFSVMKHNHGPSTADQEYHWMKEDNNLITLDTGTNELDDENELSFSTSFKLTSLEGLDFSTTEVSDKASFDSCISENREVENSTEEERWITCTGVYEWDSAEQNSPKIFIKVKDSLDVEKTLLVMIHFLDPENL